MEGQKALVRRLGLFSACHEMLDMHIDQKIAHEDILQIYEMCLSRSLQIQSCVTRLETNQCRERKIERFERCSTKCLLCMVSYTVSLEKGIVSCSVLLLQMPLRQSGTRQKYQRSREIRK